MDKPRRHRALRLATDGRKSLAITLNRCSPAQPHSLPRSTTATLCHSLQPCTLPPTETHTIHFSHSNGSQIFLLSVSSSGTSRYSVIASKRPCPTACQQRSMLPSLSFFGNFSLFTHTLRQDRFRWLCMRLKRHLRARLSSLHSLKFCS